MIWIVSLHEPTIKGVGHNTRYKNCSNKGYTQSETELEMVDSIFIPLTLMTTMIYLAFFWGYDNSVV